MRAYTKVFGAIAMIAGACAPAKMSSEQRREVLHRTTGAIVGVVRGAEGNVPLAGVSVRAQYLGAVTGADGTFRIDYVDPGEVDVIAWRRDLIETSERVRVLAQRDATVRLLIERSPPPCCILAGTWTIRLTLRESGELPVSRGTKVAGTMIFSANTPDPFPEKRQDIPPDDPTVDEFGVYEIDLRPILGDDITRSFSNTVFKGAGGSAILAEAEGFVHHGNQVDITFIPRMSHGGISLTGTIGGNKIQGEWIKRDLAPTISGTFHASRW